MQKAMQQQGKNHCNSNAKSNANAMQQQCNSTKAMQKQCKSNAKKTNAKAMQKAMQQQCKKLAE